MDETLALPTQEAVTIALRTQQIIAHETGAANTIDPLAGSYFVEYLTSYLESEAWQYIKRIDEMGGMVSAIEKGYPQREITEAAHRYQLEIEEGKRIIVGINEFIMSEDVSIPVLKIEPEVAETQIKNLKRIKQQRDSRAVLSTLRTIKSKAQTDENLMPFILEAVKAYATLGEICDVLREVFGEYQDPAEF
jgi:methylmalonyl-CoA mutase N-terminal domain/subunit